MSTKTTAERQVWGRYGGLKSWANTVDRTERTTNARKNGPGDISWHLARLDPDKFANASVPQRLAAAEAARKAYFVGLAMKSATTRRNNSKNRLSAANPTNQELDAFLTFLASMRGVVS